MFDKRNVLVTGGTGMIGRYLVKMLVDQGAHVRIVSLDDLQLSIKGADFIKSDLTIKSNCMDACNDMDYVFHLAGIKGSPQAVLKNPATFFTSVILFNTNMMESAFRSKVRQYLFTSTIGVYHPSSLLVEDDVWKTFPSKNDKHGGWAKRMGELQADALSIEHEWNKVVIVRPANVYGRYDNFDPKNSMVIPSLIRRVIEGENPLTVWGNGSAIRDFVHAEDVASGMVHMMKNNVRDPVNLASGSGVTIKKLADTIVKVSGMDVGVVWDTSKPTGDSVRLMDTKRAKSFGWESKISLNNGIRDVFEWLRDYDINDLKCKRHDVFK